MKPTEGFHTKTGVFFFFNQVHVRMVHTQTEFWRVYQALRVAFKHRCGINRTNRKVCKEVKFSHKN
jgi:hypothetical protein